MSKFKNVIVICANCNQRLYELKRVSFPLNYKLFIPLIHLGVDAVYDDPICPFCEHPFQPVPLDINWQKINMQPIKTDKGFIRPDDVKDVRADFSPPSSPVDGNVCACGCGQGVDKEGDYVSTMHKIRKVKMAQGMRA